jgi:predicted DNA-binding protein (MmcQ/YjbR family)
MGAMSPDAFHDAALALPAATFDVKWGSDRIYSVGGKMFAAAGALDPPVGHAFKASDLAFEMLVAQGLARPAPYLARAKWVQLIRCDALSDRDICAYLAQAHAIVAAGLTKKARVALGLPG